MCAQNQISVVDLPIHPGENGYLMLTRLEIKNFKCFDSQLLTGLKSFNFIVGDSGSGKTALLEALFLLSSGNPDGFFKLRRWRGFQENQIEFNGTRDSYEGLFRNLFHNNEPNTVISLRSIDTNFGKRTLDIYYKGKETFSLPLNQLPENSMSMIPVVFKWDVDNVVTNVILEIKDRAFRSEGSAPIYPLHFISPHTNSSKFNTQLFSQLSRTLKSKELQEVIVNIFPMIKGLSIEIVTGEPLIHAEVEGFKEKIPINELSGGLNKYIGIALAIAANQDGVVIIDEIEDGFYYKNHAPILKSLIQLCDQYRVQIFASTHSLEFLRSVSEVMEARVADISLLKTSYVDRTCTIRSIAGASAISAIKQDIEIRG